MSAKCPHGTYGSGCGYCGIAPMHNAFGVAAPAPIIEEVPTPELVAERRLAELEDAARRERARQQRIAERTALVLRSKRNAERARAERLADKHGVIGD